MSASFYHHLASAKLDKRRGDVIDVRVEYDASAKRTIIVTVPGIGAVTYYSEADETPAPVPHSANDTAWGDDLPLPFIKKANVFTRRRM